MAGVTGTQVECPKCGYNFPLTDAVLGLLRSQISTELEKEYQGKLTEEKATIEETASKQARKASAKQISELTSQFEKSEKELKESRGAEIKFREGRRQWK